MDYRVITARRARHVVAWALLVALATWGVACADGTPRAASSEPATSAATELERRAGSDGRVRLALDGPSAPRDPRLLSTNLPAWLGAARFEDPRFGELLVQAGIEMVRLPGGSWANGYDWLTCERGQGLATSDVCFWTWAARPSDFARFLERYELGAIWTVNLNGTAQEAAALVAFFNGSVGDARAIGVDVRGRDWGRVSDWARLRASRGMPEPVRIEHWEIGNETYAGKAGRGTDCASIGWEDTWTCDGREYVEGIGSGASRRAGFNDFARAMRAVDPSIKVGAVGLEDGESWGGWGAEVVRGAATTMDFLVLHHYAYFGRPASISSVLSVPRRVWPGIEAGLDELFASEAPGARRPELAVTEYNLFSVEELDAGKWMSSAVNALYTLETLGEMEAAGIGIASQWDFAHGEGSDAPGYGLIQAATLERSPHYYALLAWSRLGREAVPVTTSFDPGTLRAFAGRRDGVPTVLVLNKSGRALEVDVSADRGLTSARALVIAASDLDAREVTVNGRADPAIDLSDAPERELQASGGAVAFEAPPYSISVLTLAVE